MPTVLTGQADSYVADVLLAKSYTVHGIVPRASMSNRSRIERLRGDPAIYGQRLFLEYAGLQDRATGQAVLRVDPQFYRPTEPDRAGAPRGDVGQAAAQLGWRPYTTAPTLAALMAVADWARVSANS